jgi:hypothetical protein
MFKLSIVGSFILINRICASYHRVRQPRKGRKRRTSERVCNKKALEREKSLQVLKLKKKRIVIGLGDRVCVAINIEQ